MSTVLGLEAVATFSSDADDPPISIVHRVTGTAPGDWIYIERLGSEEFRWCVVWYCLEDGLWRRIAKVERLFETPETALEAVAIAFEDPLSPGPCSISAVAAATC
jgi:hypothetical protein